MGVRALFVFVLVGSSCLSEPTGDGRGGLGIAGNGVRLIGPAQTASGLRSACEILHDCCQGDTECEGFVNALTEPECLELLQGYASECLDGGSDGGGGSAGCCQPSDPCDWADDGVCDCPNEAWDFMDCHGGAEGESEAEAEAEAEGEGCCEPEDPCEWADDGWCDCPEQDWDANDCI